MHLEEQAGLYSFDDALAFMQHVSVALRYGPARNLPMASMYRATQRQVPEPEDEKDAHARAFELTNALLESGRVTEINLIAERLALASARVMPAIYALVRGAVDPDVSPAAREALDFVTANGAATSGDIRRLLRAEGQPRPDAADIALGELQRELLVDRGPSSGPTRGVFYLSREGYPYRVFASAHPEVVRMARALPRAEAARELLDAYLAAAVFCKQRQLASMFKLLLTSDDIDQTVETLSDRGIVRRVGAGRQQMIVYSMPASG